jgi:putative NADH-flavin reductase
MSKIVVIAGGGTVGIRTVQELGKRGGEVLITRSANRIASQLKAP